MAVGRWGVVQRHGRQQHVALRQHAGRQVLDDLARRAVVIDWVRRTAGNVRQLSSAVMRLVLRPVARVPSFGFEAQAGRRE
jgi:hypothetical protein